MNKELVADKCCLTLINMTLTLCSESCKGFKGEVKLSLKGQKWRKSNREVKKKGKFPQAVYKKCVANDSILCQYCKCWAHKRCSSIRGSLKQGDEFKF